MIKIIRKTLHQCDIKKKNISFMIYLINLIITYIFLVINLEWFSLIIGNQ